MTVTFDRAGSRRFDLVIGADGMHSNVRRLAFGPEEQFLRYKDHYFAFANADAALGEDRWMTMYNTAGQDGRGLPLGQPRPGQGVLHLPLRAADVRPPRHRAAQAPAQRKRSAATPAGGRRDCSTRRWPTPTSTSTRSARCTMASWSTGRVALVGDAAWCASPASGAGAELALVGAYRLAGELASAGGDHRVAFARYQDSHRELVTRKQQIGPNVRLMVPKTHGGRWIRDGLARPADPACDSRCRTSPAGRGRPARCRSTSRPPDRGQAGRMGRPRSSPFRRPGHRR